MQRRGPPTWIAVFVVATLLSLNLIQSLRLQLSFDVSVDYQSVLLASNSSSSAAATTTTTASTVEVPVPAAEAPVVGSETLPESSPARFPVWNDPQGIDIQAILQFLRYICGSANYSSRKDLLHERYKRPRIDNPQVPYVLGRPRTADEATSSVGVWVSQAFRGRPSKYLNKQRYKVIEPLLLDAFQRLQSHPDRWPRLAEAANRTGVPFLLHLDDNRFCNQHNFALSPQMNYSLPLFTVAAPSDCDHAFLVPTYSHIDYEVPNSTVQNHSSIRKAVWRGMNNGVAPVHQPEALSIRQQMVQAAANRTNMDACFVVGTRDKQRNVHPCRRIPWADFANYYAILDVDGLSWSERFGKLLCFNSVVLKVEPEMVDWTASSTQPWVHYVPVAQNSSNLAEMVDYVLDPAHDAQMQTIVSNANAWCRANTQRDRMVDYVLDSLAYYVDQLDQGNPQWEAVWKKAKLPDKLLIWQPIQR